MKGESEFWNTNQYILDEQERQNRRQSNPYEQANNTSRRIAHSVTNSPNDGSTILLIGAILLAKFVLFLLYRRAEEIDVDVSCL